MSLHPCTDSFFLRVKSVEKAAEVVKKLPPKVVELSDEAKALPPHILSVTDSAKLNAQTPFFKCPPWAALPALACHLHCTRGGVSLPSLGLSRFPFYLFGKSSVCDYVLQHPSISSIHAVLVFHGDQECFVLMDLGSTNGVKLNGSRIEKRRPVPAPIGSCIQFGFSSRIYKICLGPIPSLKRQREEEEKRNKSTVIKERNGLAPRTRLTNSSLLEDASAITTATGDFKDGDECVIRGRVADIEDDDKCTSLAEKKASCTSTTVTAEEVTGTELEKAVPSSFSVPLPEVRHLYHVLIKHKDVRRPVSLAPRNKGDKITRSKADAVALARAIIARHGDEKSVWSLEEFITVVRDYSECGSAKRDGDLGIVESGTYTEEFDLVAFALSSGAVSAPVETELGVHLIFCAD